jgi:hypothetical protein
VSAYNSKLSNEQNHANHEKAIEMLVRDNVQFQVVNGVYKGAKELVFLMASADVDTHDQNVTAAYMIGLLFNQESLLEVHNDSTAVLHYLGGDSQQIGNFTQVERIEALSHDSYTFEPVSNRYFVV